MSEQTCVLGVFLKNWTTLPVKTRLARDLGSDSAKEIYCQMVDILHQTLQKYSNAQIVWCVAGGFEGLDSILSQSSEVIEQSDGDLGQRMANFCEIQFNRGAERVLIIGTDSLYLDSSDFDFAIECLETKRLVFQPSPDGGYTLVGMNSFTPEIFENMPWSQSHLMETSVNLMKNLRFDYNLLKQRNDIDTLSDLREWYVNHAKSDLKDGKLARLLEICRQSCT